MKKKIQKSFDAEAAKRGARVETRGGRSVRIVCYDMAKTAYPIVGLVNYEGVEGCFTYSIEGKTLIDETNEEDDLVIIEEVECPKFNVGDWVFMNTHGSQPWLVIKVTPNYYEIKDSFGHITAKSHSTIDSLFHPWTLKDAKPGDVLVDVLGLPFIYKNTGVVHFPAFPVAYCGITEEGDFRVEEEYDYWTDARVKPATKEQRDRLFREIEKAGYEWDTESLTLSKIQKRWRDDENAQIDGYYINGVSQIVFRPGYNKCCYDNTFATEKQAKSALAMACISQIMKNDERFGGVVTDEEWSVNTWRYVIVRMNNDLLISLRYGYEYLAFHTKEQAELFLKENEDLIKDYYMLD